MQYGEHRHRMKFIQIFFLLRKVIFVQASREEKKLRRKPRVFVELFADSNAANQFTFDSLHKNKGNLWFRELCCHLFFSLNSCMCLCTEPCSGKNEVKEKNY